MGFQIFLESVLNPVAKGLIGAGIILIFAGLFWQFGSKFLPLGRLSGDIIIQKGNSRFYFPIMTSLLVSVILSILAYFFGSHR